MPMRRGRPKSEKKRKKRYLVVTNGEVTERQYFLLLKGELCEQLVTVKTHPKDPMALAEYARKLLEADRRDSRSEDGASSVYELVLVVTDVDQFSAENLRGAEGICKEAGMGLIISNPCFEVWLIDHVRPCPGSVQTALEAARLAEKVGVTRGKGGKELVSDALKRKLGDAVSNARRHNTPEKAAMRKRLSGLGFAPWSDMPAAVEKLGGAGK